MKHVTWRLTERKKSTYRATLWPWRRHVTSCFCARCRTVMWWHVWCHSPSTRRHRTTDHVTFFSSASILLACVSFYDICTRQVGDHFHWPLTILLSRNAAYAVVRCLSVCPSVTFVHSVETNKHIFKKQFSP